MKTKDQLIDDLITLAFAEDVGDGDHTTLSTIPADARGRQRLIVKEEGILAGVDMARRVFRHFDPDLKMTVYIEDGARVKPGDVAFEVEGSVRSLLQTERTMLNIMQRMSGIATMTARYQDRLEGLKTKVLDTRKTTPGMRLMEKEAVKIGGGANHRIGLFDMILIKDNHVDFAGGITEAVNRAKQYCKDNGKDLRIEVEVRNTAEIDEALAAGVDRIMLDNFTPERTREAVQRIAGRCEIESSGGITLDTLRQYGCLSTDQYAVGVQIGEMASEWINSQLGGAGKVVVYTTVQNQDMQNRGQGIQDAIAEKAKDAEILEVVDIGKDVVGAGTSTTENMLQKYPDLNCIVCYGDAAAVESMEAAKAAGVDAENFGIFSCDGTAQALAGIKAGDPQKGTVMFAPLAPMMAEYAERVLNGETFDDIVTSETISVTAANIDEYYTE